MMVDAPNVYGKVYVENAGIRVCKIDSPAWSQG